MQIAILPTAHHVEVSLQRVGDLNAEYISVPSKGPAIAVVVDQHQDEVVDADEPTLDLFTAGHGDQHLTRRRRGRRNAEHPRTAAREDGVLQSLWIVFRADAGQVLGDGVALRAAALAVEI